ncbi:cell division protein FtsQ/DivIB [Amphritea sp. 1_MG-2023]|uniref:cell division protein FtsQ/DivIB n=1 Tax=Amphritea sp. 1_MG-2023 TaxID=3062670 RepID=UPI0026E13592|nr:cell division protein FtsQ/DivIB [Amphritea sp. 1_MG-2023]MDO6562890.1 cell division protein FtsQ/DivIB [Amphritea sp. 1_MG-2023]
MLKKLFSHQTQAPEAPKRGASATVYKKAESNTEQKARGWINRLKVFKASENEAEQTHLNRDTITANTADSGKDAGGRAKGTAKDSTKANGINRAIDNASAIDRAIDSAIDEDGDWWIKPATLLTALAVFIALAHYSFGSLYRWLDQPVQQVTFAGSTQHLDRQQVAAKSVALMDGGLLSADIEAVKAGIQADPWVYQVGVSRRWPAALYLTVTEEVPVARWGEDGLLNHEGDIFWPDDVAKYSALPRLKGPSSHTGMMMAEYYDLNQMLRKTGLQLIELQLEARGAWTLLLDNGIRVVVGRDQVVARLERFLTVYQQRLQAEADAGRIEQIDIRYNNGIAVKWRPLAATDEQQKG